MSTTISSLVQEQINLIVDELVELKARFTSGYMMFDGELLYAPLTIEQFNERFEPLNEKLIQLQLQQAEY